MTKIDNPRTIKFSEVRYDHPTTGNAIQSPYVAMSQNFMSQTNRLVFVYVHRQSADIAGGVNTALETRDDIFASVGAGDQGTVYGYATNETWAKMPTPVIFVNDLCKRLDEARKDGTIRDVGPDGKAQVTIEYHDDKPVSVKNIIVSVQHKDTPRIWMSFAVKSSPKSSILCSVATTSRRKQKSSSTLPGASWKVALLPIPVSLVVS